MTVIDINEIPAKFFEMEGGGRVQLKIVSAGEFKEIRKQTVKKRVDFKKVDGVPGRFPFEEVDEDLQNELFWDAVIVSWENFSNKKGDPIPCTTGNKILLMTRSNKFSKFVVDSLKTLAEEEAVQAEIVSKN